MKKFRSTYIFALLAVGLVFYAYVFEYKKKQDDDKVKTEQSIVFKVKKEDVVKVEVMRPDSGFVAEKGSDGTWRLTKPVSDVADTFLVENYIDQLLNEKSELTIDDYDPAKLASFGLQPARSTIELTAKDGTKHTVHVGADAMGGKMYVKDQGKGAIFVSSFTWKSHGEKRGLDVREKSFWRSKDKPIKGVTVENLKSGFVLQFEQKDGKWVFVKPQGLMADSSLVEGLITSLKNLKGSDFVSEDKVSREASKFGFQKPILKVKIAYQEGPEWVGQFSPVKDDRSIYAVASDLNFVFDLSKTAVDMIMRPADEYRDRTAPFKFEKAQVSKVNLKTGDLKLELEKVDSGWVAKDLDPKKEVDPVKVDELLEKLSSLRVKEFVGIGKALGSAKGEVVLKDKDGKVVWDSKWGGETKDKAGIFLKTSGFSETVAVEQTAINSLPAQTLLKDKKADAAAAVAPSPTPAGK